MSYGVDFLPSWRRTADYVARILKGAKLAEIPIELPTKFELVVGLQNGQGARRDHTKWHSSGS